MKPWSHELTADVLASESLDRIVFRPRTRTQAVTLRRLIAECISGGKVSRSADGIAVPAELCHQLFNINVMADLRWTSEAQVFVRNRHLIKTSHPQLQQEIRKITSGSRELSECYLRDVDGLDVLDDHQWKNVAAMTLPGGYGLCVFDEQGTGKTITLIFAFDVLVSRDQADFALIVAPKSMIAEWQRDFVRFKQDLYKVELLVGDQNQKRKAIRSGADVLVTNYETAVSMEPELRTLLRRHQGRAILAVDESFYIKNLDAKRTRALRRLREWCGRAFVLCGTPAPNSADDVIQQFNIVDCGVVFAGISIPEDKEKAREIIQHRVENYGLYVRSLKAQVLPDLPAKRFSSLLVQLQPQQEKLYEGVLKDLILDLQNVDDEGFRKQYTSFLAKRTALFQICSNPIALFSHYNETAAKLHALDELLDNLIERKGEKVVVWSFYTSSLSAIVSRYAHFNPVRYDGSITDVRERREAVRRFQEDNDTMLFVGNPAAAGAGLTLHRARFAIYESMSNQTAHYLQSLDRIHRRGQSKYVEYLILLCDGTIETGAYTRLTQKEFEAQELFNDCVDEPLTRQIMLAEVLGAGRYLGESL
jgi:SNF2 family DNA or RNA helicase